MVGMQRPHNCEMKDDGKKNLRMSIVVYSYFEGCSPPISEVITDDKRTARCTEHRCIIFSAFYLATCTGRSRSCSCTGVDAMERTSYIPCTRGTPTIRCGTSA